ncbi:unnamed protein product [Prorocentrum cordatum]|uniref:Uncharacterized protein n=1 Tax=Prorocentrum cordatum TaxID=2364126 RepID=A0ABN9UEZ8_9DINO|nr:unnamed protein product [Polarella glacialis]
MEYGGHGRSVLPTPARSQCGESQHAAFCLASHSRGSTFVMFPMRLAAQRGRQSPTNMQHNAHPQGVDSIDLDSFELLEENGISFLRAPRTGWQGVLLTPGLLHMAKDLNHDLERTAGRFASCRSMQLWVNSRTQSRLTRQASTRMEVLLLHSSNMFLKCMF